jgi:N-acetylmuramoyl-L-alanine amidase
MSDGDSMFSLAETRIGQKYVNVLVPKNNPNWQGPWDCAEFMSWLVYQVGGFLYGCTNNNGNPALTEAYTGAWKTDVRKIGRRVPVEQAAHTRGGILLRYPPTAGAMGHIVICDGKGGTVEAMGKAYGVARGKVSGRRWDTGVLVKGMSYGPVSDQIPPIKPPTVIYAMGRSDMQKSVVRTIQRALRDAGVNPGRIDGVFGPLTAAAVAAFQSMKGLIVDGEVGRQTARKLGIELRS